MRFLWVKFRRKTESPVYIVQPGDTLNSIAERFGIGINDLLESNSLVDPNLISAGTELRIPSLSGISGILDTEVVPFGETIRSLAEAIPGSTGFVEQA